VRVVGGIGVRWAALAQVEWQAPIPVLLRARRSGCTPEQAEKSREWQDSPLRHRTVTPHKHRRCKRRRDERAGYSRPSLHPEARRRHQADADLTGLVAAGRGDTSLRSLRFRCTACRSRLTAFVVTGRDTPKPW
jgi:hypothetical protein